MNVKNGNLLVYKNGRWLMGSGGGISITEIESPEDIKADSPDGLYIQEGGTSTPSGGTTIHYYDSLDQVPADLPDGSYVTVPVNDEVVDLTGVFNYATSIGAGGEWCYVDYDGTNLLNRLKNGSVPVKIAIGDVISTIRVPATIVHQYGDYAYHVGLFETGDTLLYISTSFNETQIQYRCRQVNTSIYNPS